MESLFAFFISIIVLWAFWMFLWKPAILRLYIAYITSLFNCMHKYYSKHDISKMQLIKGIYSKAVNTPRDMDFYEFLIIVNDMQDVNIEDIRKDEDKEILAFADTCAKAMYICLRMRTVRYFIFDTLTIIGALIMLGFKDINQQKILNVMESIRKDTLSLKKFWAHS